MKNKRNKKDRDIRIPLDNEPHIEIIGNSQCVVDGLKSIVEYNRDKIILKIGKYCVTFFGDELYIDSFSTEGAIVEGNIISMEFNIYD